MAKFSRNEIAGIWKTVSELDVRKVREEAERRVSIVGLGDPAMLVRLSHGLLDGPDRYHSPASCLRLVDIADAGQSAVAATAQVIVVPLDSAHADVEPVLRLHRDGRNLVVALVDKSGAIGDPASGAIGHPASADSDALAGIDAPDELAGIDAPGALAGIDAPVDSAALDGAGRLTETADLEQLPLGEHTQPADLPVQLPRGRLVEPADLSDRLPRGVPIVHVRLSEGEDAWREVHQAILDRLDPGLHLAVTRCVPGLRREYSRRLVNEVSMSNATFAAASGIPGAIPVLGLPVAMADTVVLTKNQVLMTYRLALAHGAPDHFEKHVLEIAPVVGGGLMWREAARWVGSLVPAGVVTNIAIAFAGTYVTGHLAEIWYQKGAVTKADRDRLTREAREKAKVAAAKVSQSAGKVGESVSRVGESVTKAGRSSGRRAEELGRSAARVARRLPRRKK